MKTKVLLTLGLGASLFFTACSDDPEVKPTPAKEYLNGVFVVNEGGFNASNASIDFLDTLENKIYSDVFKSVNGRVLGDVAQSMAVTNTNGYVVLNNSAKIEVIRKKDAVSIASITGFQSPRYMVVKDSTIAYVSDWFSNSVKVIDLVSNTITSSITVGAGPESMCIVGDRLYVTNCGGYDLDSTLSVIDLNSNTELTKIVVGDAPVAVTADANGKVWVLCRGSYGVDFNSNDDDTKGQFVQIDPTNNQILKTISIGDKGDHPDKMRINAAKNTMYYLSSYQSLSGVYKFNINDNAASTTAFISGYFYGLGYDKKKDQLYLGEVTSFTQNAKIIRYTSNGTLIDSYTTGIGTNGIGE